MCLFIFIADILLTLDLEEYQTTQRKDNGNGASTTVILYNERELREDTKGFSSDLLDFVKKEGYNVWIDLTTTVTDIHSLSDLERIKQSFCLDEDAIKAVESGSKKPHARILKDHLFTIF